MRKFRYVNRAIVAIILLYLTHPISKCIANLLNGYALASHCSVPCFREFANCMYRRATQCSRSVRMAYITIHFLSTVTRQYNPIARCLSYLSFSRIFFLSCFHTLALLPNLTHSLCTKFSVSSSLFHSTLSSHSVAAANALTSDTFLIFASDCWIQLFLAFFMHISRFFHGK